MNLQTMNKRLLFHLLLAISLLTAASHKLNATELSLDSVSGKDMILRPVENVLSVLPGLIPGVEVIPHGPLPGVSPLTSIHGLATLSGLRQPLFVVDGIPVETLEDIDPADVASIKVLTDASGAALYGVRGSDGVILISTVSPEISADNRAKIDFLATFLLDNSDDDYGIYDMASRSTAPGQKYHLSIGNNNGRRSYRASVGYFGQGGLLRNTSSERLTAHAEYSYEFTRIFSGGLALSGSRREIKAPLSGMNDKETFNSFLSSAFLQAKLDNGISVRLDGAFRHRNHTALPFPLLTFTGTGLVRASLSYGVISGAHRFDINAGTSFETFNPFHSNLISPYANFGYDYAGRYTASLSLRGDGLKGSVKDRSWSLSPCLSAAWTISRESFWPEGSFVSELKLRGGLSRMATGTPSYGITSETTIGREVGLTAGFLKSRLNLVADFYTRTISDLALVTPVDKLIVGKVFCKGLDIKLTSVNLTGPLSWQTDFTMSYACNHVTDPGAAGNGSFIDGIGVVAEGEPLGSLCMYDAVGYYGNAEDLLKYPVAEGSAIGDVRYRDANDDGIIDERDRTLVGKPDPEFTFGLNNRLTYHGWDLSLLLTARAGGWLYKSLPGDTPDSRGIRKSDCFTIKNLTVGYTIPLGDGVRFIRECRLFLGTENLVSAGETGFYLTGYRPEYCSLSNRTFTIGIQARF